MEMRYSIPDYVHCYDCGHPADLHEENEKESSTDTDEFEQYQCYTFKCVKCGSETLRCFRPDCNR